MKEEISDKDREISELEGQVDMLQEEKINLTEKLSFTEKELEEEVERKNKKLREGASNKAIESSRESEENKEYFDRIDAIERRVDQIKEQIGKIRVESFDKLQKMYENKYKEYINNAENKLVKENIREKGLGNVLKELKGSMNESIRVLKYVTHEEHIWFLIEEDIDMDIEQEEPPQYWIREIDLSDEEQEYIHEYLPNSMREEDAILNDGINKTLNAYEKELKEFREERKEALKELREIRFGLKVSYYCMNEDFDEDAEQKLLEYEIKFAEYEDDIANISENYEKQRSEIMELNIRSKKQQKRIEELNGIISNISKGANESVENFLKSYKKNNELIHKNRALQEELDSKNEEIESLKNSSILGGEHSPRRYEEHKSETHGKLHKFFAYTNYYL